MVVVYGLKHRQRMLPGSKTSGFGKQSAAKSLRFPRRAKPEGIHPRNSFKEKQIDFCYCISRSHPHSRKPFRSFLFLVFAVWRELPRSNPPRRFYLQKLVEKFTTLDKILSTRNYFEKNFFIFLLCFINCGFI